ncbi:hypothetical protein AVEN_254621-1 [Araneus ventricosus]|uniref:Uncharacterized protein n=1 Tax=Araneus ventricosus TaxID=182803 RepID=A0A4Y2GEC2_ARAVE|nr:hypothetical protein AVEN_254621-1 [Araneus ventricosus]
MTNSSETKEGTNEEQMNANETEHPFEEIISGSETSDCEYRLSLLFLRCDAALFSNFRDDSLHRKYLKFFC